MNKKYETSFIPAAMAGITLEEYLKRELKLSARSRQRLFHGHGILVNGKSAYSKRILKADDRVSVRQQGDSTYGLNPESGHVEVLYEDSAIIILSKPAGMMVHPAGQTASGTLANYLAGYFSQKGQIIRIRPLHRLDRDTSGCVLFAKSAAVQQALEKQLENGKMHRVYQALVEGRLEESCGTLDYPIGRVRQRPNRRQVMENGQRAVTHYSVMEQRGEYSLLEVRLETGRTHQVRVHFSYIGHPVLGDRMYGRRSPLINRQALHASRLELIHPETGKTIQVEAPLPEDMKI